MHEKLPESEPTLRSCESSSAVGESLVGTAPRTDVWLLLEYTRPWRGKAFEESDLPDVVKARLNTCLEAIPNARLQFIQQRESPPGIHFFVAVSPSAALYRFHLNSYDELLTLDIAAVAADQPGYESLRVDERLFLVCTNGKRDACCSLHGLPLYRAMREAGGRAVWQTTHIGGHRFAPTLVCLPHGIYYGRVEPAAAPEIVARYRRDELFPTYGRGVSTYEPAAQAADLFLRQHTGMTGLPALRLVSVEQAGETSWSVCFQAGETVYRVLVARGLSDFEIVETTGDAAKKRVGQFRLVSIER